MIPMTLCIAFPPWRGVQICIRVIGYREVGYSISEDREEEQIEEEPLEEPKEEGQLGVSGEKANSDILSDAHGRPRPAESSDSYESKFKPKRGPA
ncbi:hypothetical protein Tco_1408095 [Tanacetum coccineum]